MIVGSIWTTAVTIVDLVLALNGCDIPMMLSWAWCMIGVCILAVGAIFGISSKAIF